MSTDRIEILRRWYADEVAWTSGVSDASIIEAFASVPREDFLPPGPWLFSTAMMPEPMRRTPDASPQHLYHNVVVVIDAERDLSSALPSYMASLLDFARLKRGSQVTHIGAGLGYYSAIIAKVVGATGSVAALEIDPALAARAASNLKEYPTVTCVQADGSSHQFAPASQDAIIVSAGASFIQRSWVDGLRDGGVLLVPLCFSDSEPGQVSRVTRIGERFQVEFLMDTSVYPCLGSDDIHYAELLHGAVEMYGWYSNSELRFDVHNADQSAWIATPSYWISMLERQPETTTEKEPNGLRATV